jgi:sirohydrochlorin cobaltochelatase
MSLEWRAPTPKPVNLPGEPAVVRGRAEELDAKIRGWPRRAGNDPYKEGLERVAEALRALLPTDLLAIGYNEFCRPTIAEAIDQVIGQGVKRVLVIPSMLTPGGVHAERDIPQALEDVRRSHPGITIDYLWPFDLDEVASLLAAHVRKALPPHA